jgi:hypothetical protein
MVLCINNGGVKFGEIRETDIEIWKSEVKEFVDLEGRVFIVSTNHINKPMAEGVDNIYTLRELMAAVWDEKDTKEMGCFTKTELFSCVYSLQSFCLRCILSAIPLFFQHQLKKEIFCHGYNDQRFQQCRPERSQGCGTGSQTQSS